MLYIDQFTVKLALTCAVIHVNTHKHIL